MSAGDFVRRHVFHNLTLKITSLALAVGLWVAVASSPPSEVAISAPIIFRNMSSDLEISTLHIPTLEIRVRGPERIVRRLQGSDVRAEVDLSGMKSGEHTFDLTKAVTVPDKLEVAQVVPSEIHVEFDARGTRWIPVEARVVGTFAAGYHLASARTEPDRVEIIGPKKEIDAVDRAITDPIDVTGVLDTITVMRPAYVSDPLIQVTDPHPVRVTITVEKDQSSSKTKSE